MRHEAETCKAGIRYATVYKAFARWSDDGSMEHAFIASVKHLAHYQQLDLSVLHGDGTNTVAKKGGVAWAILAININEAKK